MEAEDFHKQKTLPDLHAGELRAFPLPKKIGPYKVESLLNKGGMSFLYLAVAETGLPIAVKVLVPKYFKNKEMATRFLREAHIIGMTNHPNIVKLYGQGQWEKGLYIAMEFIRGISLRQFIQQKSLSQKRGLEIVLQVGYALCHLHAHGVIHRDLKPENILITETGEIKVIDFGIAQLQEEKEPTFPQGHLMGTPAYMSPEQKEHPENVTVASDIYALGVITYELMLGRLSHGSIHLSLLPKPLRDILGKALKENPKERYPDVVDFITDISHYLKSIREQEKEPLEEMLHWIDQGRSMLTAHQPPEWSHAEIGLAFHFGEIALDSLYLDFFRLGDSRLAIILAESSPLLSSLTLRGMFRMAFSLLKEVPAPQIFQTLNQTLGEDPFHSPFSFSFLLLDAAKNQLFSSTVKPLLHISEGSREVRKLTSSNPLLTIDNWNPGDRLFLFSREIPPIQNEKEFFLLSPQHQAEKALAPISQKSAAAALVINRVF